MKLKAISKIAMLAVILAAGTAVLVHSLNNGAAPVSASDARNGQIHIVKDCSSYNYMAGGTCMIVSSNIPNIIPTGSLVHYAQSFGILESTWLDSNVVLDAGNGNKAVGRCTVDFSISTPGVCLFFDGTGQLAGFTGRVDVSTVPTPPADYTWDGTYTFNSLPNR